MRRRQTVKLVIDDMYRLYIYKTKAILKKKNNKWIPVVISKHPSDILDSSVIDGKLKEKIKYKLSQVS